MKQLLPPVDLTELLLEIDARTGFTREFTHVSESEARAKDLHVSLCAVLLAEACNIGHEPLIKTQYTGTDPPPAQLGETELPPGRNTGQRQCPAG
ncbi:Tn3 family transposase [Pseudocitrobacter faecalis]|uniref:Tn3 family transposase n=1 Tax=Pseudocitrobacter faecalis TaxID=1398493 RepID=UPI004062AC68